MKVFYFMTFYNFVLVPIELKALKEILVFPDNDRLSKIFPFFSLGLSFNPELQTKLSFCLPRVKLPKIEILYEEEILKEIEVFNKLFF